jgi:hypothetical protein
MGKACERSWLAAIYAEIPLRPGRRENTMWPLLIGHFRTDLEKDKAMLTKVKLAQTARKADN